MVYVMTLTSLAEAPQPHPSFPRCSSGRRTLFQLPFGLCQLCLCPRVREGLRPALRDQRVVAVKSLRSEQGKASPCDRSGVVFFPESLYSGTVGKTSTVRLWGSGSALIQPSANILNYGRS